MRGEFSDLPRGGRARTLLRDLYLGWFYSKVNAFCAIGETARVHLINHHIQPAKITFSPYHVDSNLFRRQASQYDRRESRASLGIGQRDITFLFSGKFIPRKEPLLLIEAIEKLPDRGNLRLIMLGDGPLHERTMVRGKALLGERLHAPGFVNQSGLGLYFAAADILVLPSKYETWGLVVNEAMYFGLPAIVSDRVGCLPDLVRLGETGWVFQSGEPQDLACVIQKIVEEPHSAKRMGRQAKRLVEDYSTEAARDGILKALGVFKVAKA